MEASTIVEKLMTGLPVDGTVPEDVEFFKAVKENVSECAPDASYICWAIAEAEGTTYRDYIRSMQKHDFVPSRRLVWIAKAIYAYETGSVEDFDCKDVKHSKVLSWPEDVEVYIQEHKSYEKSWDETVKDLQLAWLEEIVTALESHHGLQRSA